MTLRASVLASGPALGLAMSLLGAPGVANAQVGFRTFTPSHFENYEGTPGDRARLFTLFGGGVAVIGTGVHWSVNQGDWFDFSEGVAEILAQSGDTFGTIAFGTSITLDFSGLGDIVGFSGFGIDAGPGDTTFQFFDAGGALLDEITVDLGLGGGVMEAFSFYFTTPVRTIVISGPETALDDLGALAVQTVVAGGFEPTLTETYEGLPGDRATIISLFGGSVSVVTGTTEHLSVDQGDWFDFRGDTTDPVVPQSGSRFGTSGIGAFTLDFSSLGGVYGFAGWGTDCVDFNDDVAEFEFFDLSGDPIGAFREPLGPENGTMERFSFISSTPIGSVRISGAETAFDDLSILINADVVYGSHTPTRVENFESVPGLFEPLFALFDGDVAVDAGTVTLQQSQSGLWFDFRSPGGPMMPTSGDRYGVLYGTGDVTLDFSAVGGVLSFGGRASDVLTIQPTTFEFSDLSGNPLETYTLVLGPGDGALEAFAFNAEVPIGSVRITGLETAFDDLGIRTAGGCNEADLAAPFGLLDLADIVAFVIAFDGELAPADLAPPFGLFDLSDIVAFVTAFGTGCQ